jgi:hypothetical protein
MDDDLDELRFEYHKVKSESDVKEKVRIGWNMFSCVNSIVELINEKLDPFNLSLDGWSDDLDKEKEKYEPHFRKLYKQMSVRFQIKPGVQIAMLFMSQFMVFIVPKLLSKVKTNKKDPAIQKQNPKVAAYQHPWDNATSSTKTVTKDTTAVEYTKMMKQMEEMKKNMERYSKQLKDRDQLIQQQQNLIQQFKKGTPTTTTVAEQVLEKGDVSPPQKAPQQKVTRQEQKVPQEQAAEPQSEPTDDAPELEEGSDFEDVAVEDTESNSDATDGEATGDDVDLPEPSDDFGGITEFLPVIKSFQRAQKKEEKVELNMKMFTEEPEMPDYIKEAIEQNTQEQATTPAAPQPGRGVSRGRSARGRNTTLKL